MDLITITTLFKRQNVGTIGEPNDDDNDHGIGGIAHLSRPWSNG